MMRLRNRIGILAIFATGCALALLSVLFFNSIRRSEPPPLQQVTAETVSEDGLFGGASSNEAVSAANENQITEKSGVTGAAGESQGTASLEELFLSTESKEDAGVDWGEVEQLLRDHVAANHMRLSLSDGDYARLADSMKRYREAKTKIGSLERTSANSGALRKALEESKSALEEFERVTGMSPGEFFAEEDAPVKFGKDATGSKNDDIVTEYLSDHKP